MPVRQPLHLIPPRKRTGRGGGNVFGADGPLPFVRRWRRSARKDCVRKRAVPCGMASFGFAVGVPCCPGQAISGGCRHECSRHGWSGAGTGAVSEHAAASVRSGGSYARPGGRSGTGSFGTGACGAGKRPCGMRSGLALCGGGEKAGRRSAASSVDGEPFLRDKWTLLPAVAGRSRRGTFVFRPVSRFPVRFARTDAGPRGAKTAEGRPASAGRPSVYRSGGRPEKIPRQGKPSGALVRAVGAGPTRDQLTDGRNEYSVEYSIIWAG